MEKQELKGILRNYKGTLYEEEDGKLVFESFNILAYNENEYNEIKSKIEFSKKTKSVLCTIEVKDNCFSIEEKTCSILGGLSCNITSITKESLEKLLEKYHFEHKEHIQMNLFEDF